jgi:hypothetical protein
VNETQYHKWFIYTFKEARYMHKRYFDLRHFSKTATSKKQAYTFDKKTLSKLRNANFNWHFDLESVMRKPGALRPQEIDARIINATKEVFDTNRSLGNFYRELYEANAAMPQESKMSSQEVADVQIVVHNIQEKLIDLQSALKTSQTEVDAMLQKMQKDDQKDVKYFMSEMAKRIDRNLYEVSLSSREKFHRNVTFFYQTVRPVAAVVRDLCKEIIGKYGN